MLPICVFQYVYVYVPICVFVHVPNIHEVIMRETEAVEVVVNSGLESGNASFSSGHAQDSQL
jgi:hypothetical protein